MRDLALDPTTRSLALDAAGRAALTAGASAVAQRLRLRLSLWRGEYALDQRVGVPYGQLLGRKGTRATLEATLRRAAASCPGLASLDTFTLAVDADRRAVVTLTGRTAAGEPVSLDAFVAGEG